MSNCRKYFMGAVALLAVAGLPATARAADSDPQACTINVEYFQNNVSRLTYTRDFVVSVDAPYTDDFSTATRFRFFDARVTIENSTPVVWFSWDADVNVFNAIAFQGTLKVTDQSKGETTTGRSGFFGSAVGSNTANYTLTCRKAN